MENLEKSLEGKKLEDLVTAPKGSVSNLLEPTEAEIETILVSLKEGKPYKDIKKEVRRTKSEERERTVQVTKTRPATRTVSQPKLDKDGNEEKDAEGKTVMEDVEEEYQEEYQEDKVEKYQYQLYSRGFSYGQIKEIDLGRQAKIAELTPTEKVE